MALCTQLLTAFAATILLASPFAQATTYTYTYTGNDFTTFNDQLVAEPGYPSPPTPFFTSTSSITGFFTLSSPLAPNQASILNNFSTESFDFGGYGSTPNGFYVDTDSSGNIVGWSIDPTPVGPAVHGISTSGGVGVGQTEDYAYVETYDLGFFYGSSGYDSGSNSNDPGTWTESINGVPVVNSPVPEPSTLILLATGALALAGADRRRFTTA